MSKDHKPDDPLEKARITEAGGYVAEGRVNSNLNLSRALGDLEYKKDANRPPEKQLISAMPDVKIREFAKGD
jgi:serine/threonine protein phosphatase PrpC